MSDDTEIEIGIDGAARVGSETFRDEQMVRPT